jgi:hypothetical protein
VKESWDLVETVAYWLAELSGPQSTLLEQMAERLPCLAVEVAVHNPKLWWEPGDPHRTNGRPTDRRAEKLRIHLDLGDLSRTT